MTVLPFTTFWTQRMSPEYKEAVVKRALEQLKDSPEAHRELAESINAVVRIAGFKNSSIARVPHLTKPVVRQLDFSNDLAAAVLKAWAKSRQHLHDAVTERLANSGISVDYPDFGGGGFRGVWSASDWRRESDAILERRGEFESDDVLLMLCYTTGRMPSDDEAAGENPRQPISGEPANGEGNMLNTADLSQWKDTLNSLPSDSPMWEGEIQAFAEWLSNLAGEKAAERGIAIRWREVVSEMSEPGAMFEQLNSAGVSVDSWSKAEFDSSSSASKALDVAEELKAVVENLVEHLAGSSNLGQVLEFYERIKTLSGELDAILASPRRPDDEPPKPANIAAGSSGGDSAPPDTSDASPRQNATGASALGEDDSDASVPDDKDARGESVDVVSETEIGGEESDEIVPPDAPTDDSADSAEDGSATGERNAGEDREDAPAEEDEAKPESQDDAASPDELKAAMWAMVEEDDLSGAYWIARSLEAQGRDMPAPSRLFAAAQGAKWLSPNSDAYVEDLFEVVSGHEIPEKNDVQKLLGLAAALQASVIKPETNLAAWLDSPESCRQLERVVAPIREFKDFGIPARPEDIDGSDGIEELRNSIAEASADAREWLEESLSHSHTYPPATTVFRNLCGNGVVREMLNPVANDERGYAEQVKAVAQDIRQEAAAVNAVNRIQQSIFAKGSPIVSHARNWLVGKIQEAANKAIHWCDLVEREKRSEVGGNKWWMEQVSNLRGGVGDNSQEVFVALDELRSDSRDAAAGCVARSLARLLEYLRLPIPENAALPAVSTVAEYLDATAADRADRLETAMGRRLIWTPSVRLGDDCLPAPDSFDEMGRRLLEHPATLPDALKRRVEVHQDHRFYDVMSVRLSETCRADLEALREKARKGSEDALVDHAASARQDLHQAVRDGILEFDSSEWEDFNSQIAYFISDDSAELNHDANVDDFQTAHEGIEAIQDALGGMRDEKRDELRRRWNVLLANARERADSDESAMRTWETKITQADRQEDARVMEVCVTRLNNYLNGDERLLPASQYDSAPRSAFDEFDKFLRGIPDPKERARGSSGLRALANA